MERGRDLRAALFRSADLQTYPIVSAVPFRTSTLMIVSRASDERHMKDRRNNTRLLCAELVQLSYRDESGHQRRRVANLEDISLSGACLQVDKRVPDGTSVVIRYGDGELVGTVRYCSFRDTSYFLGIRFEEGCRWSTKHFRPEHLLDPRDLVEGVLRRREAGVLKPVLV